MRKNYNKNSFILKKVFMLFLVFVCLNIFIFSYADTNYSNSDIILIIDDKEASLGKFIPYKENETIMIPLRKTCDAMQAEIKWLGKYNTIIIKKDDVFISMPIRSNKYSTNKNDFDINSKVINGTTYVPLDFLSQSFNYDIEKKSFSVASIEKEFIFIFTKKQDVETKEIIKDKISRDVYLKNNINPKNVNQAKDLLKLYDIPSNYNTSIYFLNKDKNAVRYEIDNLYDKAINFIYGCVGKRDDSLNKHIINHTTCKNSNDLFVNYGIDFDSFLYKDKLFFKDDNLFIIDKDKIRLYLSTLDLKNNKISLLCVEYSISTSQDKLLISKIYPINKAKDIKKSNNKNKTSNMIKTLDKEVWTIDDSEFLTKTTFYIQEKKDGKYKNEIKSNYEDYVDWTQSNTSLMYRQMDKNLAYLVLDNCNLSENEANEIINNGFRVNVYAEVKAIAPNEKEAKWYRYMKNPEELSLFGKNSKNQNKSAIYNLSKKILSKFPYSNRSAKKSFVFQGEKHHKKTLLVNFIDKDTKRKIAKQKIIQKYSDENKTKYFPPKKIDNLYELSGDKKVIVYFNSNKKDQTIEIDIEYTAKDIEKDTADIVLDEWRLSKYLKEIPVIDKSSKLKLLLPKIDKNGNTINNGFIYPSHKSVFAVKATMNNNFAKVDYYKNFEKDVSINNTDISKKANFPIYLKRPDMYSNRLPSYFSQIGGLSFNIENKDKHKYIAVNDDMKLLEPIKINYDSDNTFINLSFLYLAHNTIPMEAIKFDEFRQEISTANEFGVSYPDSKPISVIPDVMMIYDDENGNTNAKFVKSDVTRTINPLVHSRGKINLQGNVSVKTNANNKKNAYALARAMKKSNTAVIDKGAGVDIDYASKDVLKVSTYHLGFNEEYISDSHIEKLGINGNTINANLKAYISLGEKSYTPVIKAVNLIKNDKEVLKKHQLEIRSGRVISVDGIYYDNLSQEMKTVLENMKLIGNRDNNVLNSFARNEGQAVNEEIFNTLSSRHRHISHQIGNGWYNEDCVSLFLFEKSIFYDLENTNINLKAPLNVKELETPMNYRMRYSRGKLADVNIELSLNNNSKFEKKFKSVFILPNSER